VTPDLKQSLALKLNKSGDNHLPTWYENAESRFLSASVSTEEDRFNLLRDALSDEPDAITIIPREARINQTI